MKKLLLVTVIILWVSIGVTITTHHFTRNKNLNLVDIPIVWGCGAVLGPIAVVIILDTLPNGPVIVKQRAQ